MSGNMNPKTDCWRCVIGTAALFAATLPLAGCRTPWLGSPIQISRAPEPDFDRLIEIEQRDSRDDYSSLPPNRRQRPGRSASSRHQDDAALDDYQDRNMLASSSGARQQLDDRSGIPASRRFADNEDATMAPRPDALLDRISNALQQSDSQQSDSRKSNLAQSDKAPEVEPAFAREPVRHSKPPIVNDEQLAGETRRGAPAANRIADSASDSVAYRFNDDDVPSMAWNNTPDDRRTPDDSRERTASDRHMASRAETHDDWRGEKSASDAVTFASHQRPAADSSDLSNFEVRELAHALIAKLQQTEADVLNPDEKIDWGKKRRLVNLVLDDLDAAAEPIDGLQAEAQDYFRDTLQGLYDATDINGNPVASRRLTLALRSHRKAADSLSKLANLEVSNLAFCTEVNSFGVVTKFPDYKFRPNHHVLLYGELDNFVSESVRAGAETQLLGSYEILSSDGRRIADQILPEDTDLCARKRRDFYVAYEFHLPSTIEPGRYTLKLTIEDMKGHKFGQSSIDFEIIR